MKTKLWGNFKIGHRLGIGFGIVILMTAIMGVSALYQLQTLAGLTEQIYLHPFVVSNAVRDIKANINGMHRSMKDVAIADTLKQIDEAALIVSKNEQQVYKDFTIVFERFIGKKNTVNLAREMFFDWKAIRDEVIILSWQGKKEEAAYITREKGALHVEKMTDSIQIMIDYADRKANDFRKDEQKIQKRINITMVGFFVFTILMGITISILITNSIINPLKIGRAHV